MLDDRRFQARALSVGFFLQSSKEERTIKKKRGREGDKNQAFRFLVVEEWQSGDRSSVLDLKEKEKKKVFLFNMG